MINTESLLSSYCCNLLGERETDSRSAKPKKKKKKKISNQINTNRVKECLDTPTEVNEGILNCADVDNDIRRPNENEILHETSDGFKIIDEIPPDDSDVSDAFDSDLDESEWMNEVTDRINVGKESIVKNEPEEEKNIPSCLENLKKPLMKMIKEFGMEDRLYLDKDMRPSLRKSTAVSSNEKSKVLLNKDMKIIDYSKRRGKKKKIVEENEETQSSVATNVSKAEAKSSLKKARYEVFKLGISNGDENTRKKAKIDLAIKLGAKPPRKEAVNYKKLIEIRKQENEKEKKTREEEKEMGLPVKKAPVIKKSKNTVDINPGIGAFRNGVLTLSKKDIESIKENKSIN